MIPRTLDELSEDLKQGRTPPPEAWAKARAWERSQLPAGIAWPREGEEYECTEDCVVGFVTHWHVAFTGGGKGKVLRGERLRIGQLDEPQPIFVPASPVELEKVQARVVLPEDSGHPNYAGFSLSVRMRDLIAKFRRVA